MKTSLKFVRDSATLWLFFSTSKVSLCLSSSLNLSCKLSCGLEKVEISNFVLACALHTKMRVNINFRSIKSVTFISCWKLETFRVEKWFSLLNAFWFRNCKISSSTWFSVFVLLEENQTNMEKCWYWIKIFSKFSYLKKMNWNEEKFVDCVISPLVLKWWSTSHNQ